MAYEYLSVDIETGVALVRIRREHKRNALSEATRDELIEAFLTAGQDPSVGVLALTGGTEVFSSGFDLEEVIASRFGTFEYRAEQWNETIFGFPKPIVVGVAGAAMAGGFDLALCGDVILAAENAVFAHPEVEFGALPSIALLEPRVGTARARTLAITGRKVEAKEALTIGLVDKIVVADRLLDEMRATAAALVNRVPATLRGMRTAGWRHLELTRRLAEEQQLTAAAMTDPRNLIRLKERLAQIRRNR